MPKAPASISSRKIKKLAQKAVKSASMLTTQEIRELGASVIAYVSPPSDEVVAPARKAPANKAPAQRL